MSPWRGYRYHARVLATHSPSTTFTALFVLVVGAVLGCSTTRTVRPLGSGNAAFGVSAGGPLVHAMGADLATPIVTVSEAYGVSDELDAFANVDLTAAAYGDLHLQPGAAYHLLGA